MHITQLSTLYFFLYFRRDMQHFGVKVSIIEPGFFKTGVTSLEIIEKDLNRLWDRLAPDVKCAYGDKYFQNCK